MTANRQKKISISDLLSGPLHASLPRQQDDPTTGAFCLLLQRHNLKGEAGQPSTETNLILFITIKRGHFHVGSKDMNIGHGVGVRGGGGVGGRCRGIINAFLAKFNKANSAA